MSMVVTALSFLAAMCVHGVFGGLIYKYYLNIKRIDLFACECGLATVEDCL